MLAFFQREHIHGRKTQRFNLTVQRLLKLCPGFTRGPIPVFDLRGVRRRFWDLRQIRLHIESVGLAKYEAIFRENDIDETVLQNLTAEDLKELGVASLGHRRKLLDAIAALRTDAGVTWCQQTSRRRLIPFSSVA